MANAKIMLLILTKVTCFQIKTHYRHKSLGTWGYSAICLGDTWYTFQPYSIKMYTDEVSTNKIDSLKM